MARGPRDKYEDESLGAALRWLRVNVGLRQSEVAANATEQGDELSVPYYSECERGAKYPSQPKLDVMLHALGSNRAELDEILDQAPWSGDEARYENYRSAKAITSPPHTAENNPLIRARRTAPTTTSVNSTRAAPVQARLGHLMALSAPLASSPTKIADEAAEIAGIYQATSRSNQLTLLAFARNLARRSPVS